ncbi:hypothetical protein Kpol_1049p15 [Vanderwaltozyma polyspora DSM 70294]|uniref:Uncharacterized protein n=1 Tax=Vanderwaltozyma polyspora (strain ATCC 22028 / DSM 70294 / BCRC 21397 / CBS 2163 / NBRC 10782 / NRRL Y-8283 / UCD 57-17) TaxID=436907 RepID=A7TPQ5_VANPO|nr:uncharacterized protein Kpol_1049p15 [Vanderwaltozyma polyspora DSM 70294]EDO15757.1 hypothetical protein Kpol_1049p15 [Vanderwaltozyma polyspora DSM 70294]
MEERKLDLSPLDVDEGYDITQSGVSEITHTLDNELVIDIQNSKKRRHIPYMSNYFSALHNNSDKLTKKRISLTNESLLKRYYETRKSVAYNYYRNSSIVSSSDSAATQSNEKLTSFFSTENIFGLSEDQINSYTLMNNVDLQFKDVNKDNYDMDNNNENDTESSDLGCEELFNSAALTTYYNYYQGLLTVDPKDLNVMKDHHLWMPSLRKDYRYLLFRKGKSTLDPYAYKTCPLFIEGTGYIPEQYDTYAGSTMIPGIFSEVKLPSLVHHCSVECDDQMYILGGLMACYRYDEEAPNLNDFTVKGVDNLPPPIIPDVINNPAMVDNPHLYVLSYTSSRLTRPQLSGNIPPPLLCMQGSKLTDRYIFYYGGFELKTKTHVDENGKYHLEKCVFINNAGYILDTLTFRFTKIDVMSQPYSFISCTSLSARFGHCQVSLGNEVVIEPSTKTGDVTNTSYDESNDQTSISGVSSVGSDSTSILRSASPMLDPTKSLSNNTHQSNAFSVLVFGGYTLSNGDKYEAMDDMWKIEIPVVARGKIGYYKFDESANASMIPIDNAPGKWPSKRGFAGSCIPSIPIPTTINSEEDILKKLENEFEIEYNAIRTDKNSSTAYYKVDQMMNDSVDEKNANESFVFIRRKEMNNRNENIDIVPKDIQPNFFKPIPPKEEKESKKTLVLYGGSNYYDVYGDMWWFDLDGEKWECVSAFAKTENNDEGMVPIEVPNVGHSLCPIGSMLVCVGGLTPEDVNDLYPESRGPDDKSHERHSKENDYEAVPVGSALFTILDLDSQCLEGQKIKHSDDGYSRPVYTKITGREESQLIRSIGSTAIQINGTIILVGGLVAVHGKLTDLYLRGTVLHSVMPSISLST